MYFKDIVRNEKPFEICRLFTATLQLVRERQKMKKESFLAFCHFPQANDRNVDIGVGDSGEDGVNTMNLKLLSTRLGREAVSEYQLELQSVDLEAAYKLFIKVLLHKMEVAALKKIAKEMAQESKSYV